MMPSDYVLGRERALLTLGFTVKHAVSEDWLIKRLSKALGEGIDPERLHTFRRNIYRIKGRNSVESAGNYQDKPKQVLRMSEILADGGTGKSKVRAPFSRTPDEIISGKQPAKPTAEEFLRKHWGPPKPTDTSKLYGALGTAAEGAAKGPAQNAADARGTWAAPSTQGPSHLPDANVPTSEADVSNDRLMNRLGLAGAGLGLTGMGLGAYALMRDKPKDESVVPQPPVVQQSA
jgi:hypothetical protein